VTITATAASITISRPCLNVRNAAKFISAPQDSAKISIRSRRDSVGGRPLLADPAVGNNAEDTATAVVRPAQ
jgi:hypothetical protein